MSQFQLEQLLLKIRPREAYYKSQEGKIRKFTLIKSIESDLVFVK